ncbi:MAG: hypothetical protein ACPGYV_04590, partial [Phycisphaeraceae bacterium]
MNKGFAYMDATTFLKEVDNSIHANIQLADSKARFFLAFNIVGALITGSNLVIAENQEPFFRIPTNCLTDIAIYLAISA